MKKSLKIIALSTCIFMSSFAYAENVKIGKVNCIPQLAEDMLTWGGAATGALLGGAAADWVSGGGTTLCIASIGASAGSGGWLAGLVPFACNPVSMAITASGAAAGSASGAIAGHKASKKLENLLCSD